MPCSERGGSGWPWACPGQSSPHSPGLPFSGPRRGQMGWGRPGTQDRAAGRRHLGASPGAAGSAPAWEAGPAPPWLQRSQPVPSLGLEPHLVKGKGRLAPRALGPSPAAYGSCPESGHQLRTPTCGWAPLSPDSFPGRPALTKLLSRSGGLQTRWLCAWAPSSLDMTREGSFPAARRGAHAGRPLRFGPGPCHGVPCARERGQALTPSRAGGGVSAE